MFGRDVAWLGFLPLLSSPLKAAAAYLCRSLPAGHRRQGGVTTSLSSCFLWVEKENQKEEWVFEVSVTDPSAFYYNHRTENTDGFKSTDLPASTHWWPRESLNQGQPGRHLLYPSQFPSLCLLMSLFKYGIIAFPGLITILNMNSSHLQDSQQPQLTITLDITLQQASSFYDYH